MNPEGLPLSTSASPARPPRRLPDWLLFLAKFFRHGKAIASFVPSSSYLARAVMEGVDWSAARCVVELGAGTGPITAELLRHVPPACKAVVVERDPDFCERLCERFPGADVAQADAADLDRLLAERGVEKVYHFLCGLPLPSFPREVREAILQVVRRRMAPGGTFRQLTHMPYVYYRMYRRYFPDVRFRLVLRNLPPAGFYVCQAPQAPDGAA
jgi:phospholipid N-methyltransferase